MNIFIFALFAGVMIFLWVLALKERGHFPAGYSFIAGLIGLVAGAQAWQDGPNALQLAVAWDPNSSAWQSYTVGAQQMLLVWMMLTVVSFMITLQRMR